MSTVEELLMLHSISVTASLLLVKLFVLTGDLNAAC